MYSLALGRRKSWVVPIQLASATALLLSADWADARLQVSCFSSPAGSARGETLHPSTLTAATIMAEAELESRLALLLTPQK